MIIIILTKNWGNSKIREFPNRINFRPVLALANFPNKIEILVYVFLWWVFKFLKFLWQCFPRLKNEEATSILYRIVAIWNILILPQNILDNHVALTTRVWRILCLLFVYYKAFRNHFFIQQNFEEKQVKSFTRKVGMTYWLLFILKSSIIFLTEFKYHIYSLCSCEYAIAFSTRQKIFILDIWSTARCIIAKITRFLIIF